MEKVKQMRTPTLVANPREVPYSDAERANGTDLYDEAQLALLRMSQAAAYVEYLLTLALEEPSTLIRDEYYEQLRQTVFADVRAIMNDNAAALQRFHESSMALGPPARANRAAIRQLKRMGQRLAELTAGATDSDRRIPIQNSIPDDQPIEVAEIIAEELAGQPGAIAELNAETAIQRAAEASDPQVQDGLVLLARDENPLPAERGRQKVRELAENMAAERLAVAHVENLVEAIDMADVVPEGIREEKAPLVQQARTNRRARRVAFAPSQVVSQRTTAADRRARYEDPEHRQRLYNAGIQRLAARRAANVAERARLAVQREILENNAEQPGAPLERIDAMLGANAVEIEQLNDSDAQLEAEQAVLISPEVFAAVNRAERLHATEQRISDADMAEQVDNTEGPSATHPSAIRARQVLGYKRQRLQQEEQAASDLADRIEAAEAAKRLAESHSSQLQADLTVANSEKARLAQEARNLSAYWRAEVAKLQTAGTESQREQEARIAGLRSAARNAVTEARTAVRNAQRLEEQLATSNRTLADIEAQRIQQIAAAEQKYAADLEAARRAATASQETSVRLTNELSTLRAAKDALNSQLQAKNQQLDDANAAIAAQNNQNGTVVDLTNEHALAREEIANLQKQLQETKQREDALLARLNAPIVSVPSSSAVDLSNDSLQGLIGRINEGQATGASRLFSSLAETIRGNAQETRRQNAQILREIQRSIGALSAQIQGAATAAQLGQIQQGLDAAFTRISKLIEDSRAATQVASTSTPMDVEAPPAVDLSGIMTQLSALQTAINQRPVSMDTSGNTVSVPDPATLAAVNALSKQITDFINKPVAVAVAAAPSAPTPSPGGTTTVQVPVPDPASVSAVNALSSRVDALTQAFQRGTGGSGGLTASQMNTLQTALLEQQQQQYDRLLARMPANQSALPSAEEQRAMAAVIEQAVDSSMRKWYPNLVGTATAAAPGGSPGGGGGGGTPTAVAVPDTGPVRLPIQLPPEWSYAISSIATNAVKQVIQEHVPDRFDLKNILTSVVQSAAPSNPAPAPPAPVPAVQPAQPPIIIHTSTPAPMPVPMPAAAPQFIPVPQPIDMSAIKNTIRDEISAGLRNLPVQPAAAPIPLPDIQGIINKALQNLPDRPHVAQIDQDSLVRMICQCVEDSLKRGITVLSPESLDLLRAMLVVPASVVPVAPCDPTPTIIIHNHNKQEQTHEEENETEVAGGSDQQAGDKNANADKGVIDKRILTAIARFYSRAILVDMIDDCAPGVLTKAQKHGGYIAKTGIVKLLYEHNPTCIDELAKQASIQSGPHQKLKRIRYVK